MTSKSIKKIITFLAITLALSCIFYVVIIKSGSINANGGLYVLGLMWAPGTAGIITQLVFEHSLRGMGWGLGKGKYLLLAYLIPLGYCVVVYGITWLTGMGGVPNPEFIDQIVKAYSISQASAALPVIGYCLVMATLGVLLGAFSSLGEEIGWRGLLVPELAKITSFRNTSLISGAVWTIWHLPLILFSDYSLPGTPRWYSVLMFAILVMSISVIFSDLRIRSGSLWTAVLMHSSHNVFVQSLFTPLTTQSKITPYIIDEFGVGLALVGLILAVYFLRKDRDLAPISAAEAA